jgi:hypothetical protein
VKLIFSLPTSKIFILPQHHFLTLRYSSSGNHPPKPTAIYYSTQQLCNSPKSPSAPCTTVEMNFSFPRRNFSPLGWQEEKLFCCQRASNCIRIMKAIAFRIQSNKRCGGGVVCVASWRKGCKMCVCEHWWGCSRKSSRVGH